MQLGGSETGELRVRMAVVAGAPDSPSVQQMVALLSSSDFAQASVPTLQVCVQFRDRRQSAAHAAAGALARRLSDAGNQACSCKWTGGAEGLLRYSSEQGLCLPLRALFSKGET